MAICEALCDIPCKKGSASQIGFDSRVRALLSLDYCWAGLGWNKGLHNILSLVKLKLGNLLCKVSISSVFY